MKAYVSPGDPLARDIQGYQISLTATPSFTMQRKRAEFLAYWLNAGPTTSAAHHCRFELEEVEPAQFAIVCADHPETAAPAPSMPAPPMPA